MKVSYSLTHLSDSALLQDLAASVVHENGSTAWVLAHIAETDWRRLFVPAGYPSMKLYCIHELRLSEDAAKKRTQAARAAREFPVLFEAVADGRLHLSGVCLLAPHLNAGNADELLNAASFKTKADIEALVRARFPRSELLPLVEAIPNHQGAQGAPGHPVSHAADGAPATERAPGHVVATSPIQPIAAQRFALHFTVGQEANDLLRTAQELLGHTIPSGDIGEIFLRAMKLLVVSERKRKFAATDRPRRPRKRAKTNGRHIPADVKRAVCERDGGQCTFVSDSGVRCPSCSRLEYDHVLEFARGGEATVDNLRLRCRAHNHYTAEQTYGAAFMEQKRDAARRAASERREQTTAAAHALTAETLAEAIARAKAPTFETLAEAIARAKATAAAERADDRDVAPWLHALGFSRDEIRRAVELCETVPDLSLEDRVRVALAYLRPGKAAGGAHAPVERELSQPAAAA